MQRKPAALRLSFFSGFPLNQVLVLVLALEGVVCTSLQWPFLVDALNGLCFVVSRSVFSSCLVCEFGRSPSAFGLVSFTAMAPRALTLYI